MRKKLNSEQSKTVYVLKKGRSIKYPESATESNLEIILKITLKGTVRVLILIKIILFTGLRSLISNSMKGHK